MKPVVLIFVRCYLPGFRGGGPIRTIANLVEQLGDEFEFRIVARDRDLGSSRPYENVVVDSWNPVGKAQVFYASPKGYSFYSFNKILQQSSYDVLYLNSFFEPVFTLKPLILRKFGRIPVRPVVVAPHGEFSENALLIKKNKKRVFLFFEKVLGLFSNITWHASTKLEAADILRERKAHFSSIKIATNLVARPNDLDCEMPVLSKRDGAALRVCFLSRISPMKNLDFALKVLLNVGEKIEFSIYGPKESLDYWIQCEKLIALLPKNINVAYLGSVDPSDVKSVISKHDLFFVPTKGENFGHVFIESFSCGVPVLLSDRTPWRDLEKKGIGWDISLEKPSEFVDALTEMCNLNEVRRQKMRASCVNFALKTIEDKEVLRMNRELFLEAQA